LKEHMIGMMSYQVVVFVSNTKGLSAYVVGVMIIRQPERISRMIQNETRYGNRTNSRTM